MSRGKTKRRAWMLIVVAFLTMLSVFSSSSAAPLPIVAGLGNRYLTKPAVTRAGTALNFRNLDVALHDVQSIIPGFFFSAVIGVGKQAPVIGAQSLPKGTYGFYCSIHPFMTANLKVV